MFVLEKSITRTVFHLVILSFLSEHCDNELVNEKREAILKFCLNASNIHYILQEWETFHAEICNPAPTKKAEKVDWAKIGKLQSRPDRNRGKYSHDEIFIYLTCLPHDTIHYMNPSFFSHFIRHYDNGYVKIYDRRKYVYPAFADKQHIIMISKCLLQVVHQPDPLRKLHYHVNHA